MTILYPSLRAEQFVDKGIMDKSKPAVYRGVDIIFVLLRVVKGEACAK